MHIRLGRPAIRYGRVCSQAFVFTIPKAGTPPESTQNTTQGADEKDGAGDHNVSRISTCEAKSFLRHIDREWRRAARNRARDGGQLRR